MKVLRDVNIEDIVFLDIETVRTQKELKEGTPDYDAWKYKMQRIVEEKGLDIFETYKENSALYPEFAKIVCITVGRVKGDTVYLTTYKDKNEKELLEKFTIDLNKVTKKKPRTRLCGHSIKGFDMPFILRRCIVNGIVPNDLIDTGALKPWEINAIDTKEIWKGTGYYNSSLVSICLALGLESSKTDITGKEVGDVYYNEGEEGLKRISEYCERDVFSLVNIVRKLKFQKPYETFVSKEAEDLKKENLMTRIANRGIITEEDKEAILSKVSGKSIDDKEKIIKLLKAGLKITNNTLDENFELEILKA